MITQPAVTSQELQPGQLEYHRRRQQMADTLRLLVEPESVFEVRGLDVFDGFDYTPKYRGTVSGFFDWDDLDDAAEENLKLSGRAKGVYWCMNPLTPDILARACNRMRRVKEGEGASDKHVTRRRWLLIDTDPDRDPKDIMATEEERAAAFALGQQVRDFLDERQFQPPIEADSGNGLHLLYRVNMPADDGELIKHTLVALAVRFNNDRVKIDTSVFNPARICRLPWTMNCKGDNTDTPAVKRVHRQAKLLAVPGCDDVLTLDGACLEVVAETQLRELLADLTTTQPTVSLTTTPTPKPTQSTNGTGVNHVLDGDRWLTDRGVTFRKKSTPTIGVAQWQLVCPFDPAHKLGDAWIAQEASGRMLAGCSHDSCRGRQWAAFKEKIGEPDSEHYNPPKCAKRTATHAAIPIDSTPASDKPHLTDAGNAIRYADEHGGIVRYCFRWSKWLVWDRCRWRIDDGGEPMTLAKRTVCTMFSSAVELCKAIRDDLKEAGESEKEGG